MDPRTVDARREELQLVDVREGDEWAAGHIAGSLHIPMDDVAGRLSELDTDRQVVTVCRSGRRSGEVAEHLSESGYRARNLEGGLERWSQEGLPLTASDGGAGRVA